MVEHADMHEFLATHPVFTGRDLARVLGNDARALRQVHNRLYYHTRRGRIVAVGGGLYAAIPPGADPATYPVDPYLIAAHSAPGAILCLHTALELHGVAYSLFNVKTCYAAVSRHARTWRGVTYRTLIYPAALRRRGIAEIGTATMDRSGLPVRVTTLERTLVDTLATPAAAGGVEEVWRSLGAVQYLDTTAVVDYVERLGSATTAARVGFFLEQHQRTLGVPDDVLERLEAMRPLAIHYFSRNEHRAHRDGVLRKRWHLVVPTTLVNQTWDELAGMEPAMPARAASQPSDSGTDWGEGP